MAECSCGEARIAKQKKQNREAEAKGHRAAAAAKAKAKIFKQAAIEQFEEAVKLDDSLLEARLNLGEVYISLNDSTRPNSITTKSSN